MERQFLCAAIVLTLAAPLNAEEFQVNTRPADSQCNPSVAATAEGDFVVVWSSYYGRSGRSNEIIARRFDATGAPLDAEEFQANTTGAGNQTEPAVAIGAAGDFFIAWEGPGPAGMDIFARLFDPNGSPLTDELLVNAQVAGQRTCPRVAGRDDGSFVVVWEDKQTDPNATACVWGQSFDALGGKQGAEFLVAADVWDCRYPDVATDANGHVVVTWLLDRTSRSVQGRLFDANGLALTDSFAVSETDFSSITRPSVAMDSHGRFAIVWDGDPNLARLDNIHIRYFEPNGLPRSGEFLANTLCEGAQQWPRVAVNDANEVIIVWQSDSDDPNLATDIHARRFDMQGRPAAEQICLNGYVQGKQRYPAVALAADGAFVAAWENAEPDDSDYDIVALIEPALPLLDPNNLPGADPNGLEIPGDP